MCEVSVFEWVSGVVVPIMLGLATLGVAVWAGRLAGQANRLSERIHAAEVAERERLARAEFVLALGRLTGAHLSAQLAGMGRPSGEEDLELNERLARAVGVVGTVDVQQVARFGMRVVGFARVAAQDRDAWFARVHAIKDVTDRWQQDPAAGVALAQEKLRELGLDDDLTI